MNFKYLNKESTISELIPIDSKDEIGSMSKNSKSKYFKNKNFN